MEPRSPGHPCAALVPRRFAMQPEEASRGLARPAHVRDVKEKLAYIAPDFDTEKLADVASDFDTKIDTTFQCFMKCDVDMRNELYSNAPSRAARRRARYRRSFSAPPFSCCAPPGLSTCVQREEFDELQARVDDLFSLLLKLPFEHFKRVDQFLARASGTFCSCSRSTSTCAPSSGARTLDLAAGVWEALPHMLEHPQAAPVLGERHLQAQSEERFAHAHAQPAPELHEHHLQALPERPELRERHFRFQPEKDLSLASACLSESTNEVKCVSFDMTIGDAIEHELPMEMSLPDIPPFPDDGSTAATTLYSATGPQREREGEGERQREGEEKRGEIIPQAEEELKERLAKRAYWAARFPSNYKAA